MSNGVVTSGCEVCSDLNVMHPGPELDIVLSSTRTTAQSGCKSCLLVSTALEPYGEHLQDEDTIYLTREGEGTLTLRIAHGLVLDPRIELDFFVPKGLSCNVPLAARLVLTQLGTSCPWPTIKPMTPNFGASDAVVAADQIRKWLKTCTEQHESGVCRAISMPQPLPTRLLELQGPQQVRLYTPSPDERGSYVCLSHCWGGNVKLQTTSITKKGFEKQVKWEEIPRSFRHAIDMTWRLGLKYIWIDSLCIIQDSLDDWRREGGNMASICA
jgi:hypothetical protein